MSSNVFFVGLNYDYVGEVTNALALQAGRFFMDINKLITYSLVDIERVKSICGIEYLKKEQKSILMGIKDYENTFINMPYDFIIDEEFSNLFKNETIIFIKQEKNVLIKDDILKTKQNNLKIELLVYEEMNKLLEQKATLTITSNGKLNSDIKQINIKLKEINL